MISLVWFDSYYQCGLVLLVWFDSYGFDSVVIFYGVLNFWECGQQVSYAPALLVIPRSLYLIQ